MNGVRGETEIDIAGDTRRLCLTLGALAQIETTLGCKTLSELQARLRRLGSADLTIVLAALLKGAGEPVDGIEGVSPKAAAKAVAEAFHAALV